MAGLSKPTILLTGTLPCPVFLLDVARGRFVALDFSS
jgi:hypothetical protein